MKKNLLPACLTMALSIVLQGCLKDKVTYTYTMLIPVYKTKQQVKDNIRSNAPQAIKSTGKIVVYGNYIFLNEADKGVHVIDNSDPAHPVGKAFINVPGNMDIAVKDNIMYADMYGDLVAIDIADPLHASLLKDLPNVFPERSYVNGFLADGNQMIIGWIKKDTTVAAPMIKNSNPTYLLFSAAQSSGNTAVAATGITGSMARFSLLNNFLYTVDHHTLQAFSIANSSNPTLVSSINAGWDIETIYPLKDKLFLGSMGGMFIFDISNGAQPVKQSEFVHARACDPVVADDQFAYITLRAGTNCGATANELHIVNIGNINSPLLLKTYPMTNPYGLSKDGHALFICDGTGGLKVYNAANLSSLQLVKQVPEIAAHDVIAWNGNAVVVADDGVYQFDYSDLNSIRLRSKITVTK